MVNFQFPTLFFFFFAVVFVEHVWHIIAEAKEEYIARYIGGSIGRLTWPAAASSRPNLSDQTNPDCGPLSPVLTARLPPLDVTPDEAALLGYMPHRDDFERVFIFSVYYFNLQVMELFTSLSIMSAIVACSISSIQVWIENKRRKLK